MNKIISKNAYKKKERNSFNNNNKNECKKRKSLKKFFNSLFLI